MGWRIFFNEKKEVIEQKILEYSDQLNEDGLLKNAVTYSLKAGGKRIRPFLALLTAALLNKDDDLVFPYAVSLEFIHTYSLIHDDLPAMDDDDLRRGKPSSHKAFGEDVAILAGDALLTDAFRLLFDFGKGDVVRGGRYLSQAAGGQGMVLGQVLDCTIAENERNVDTLNQINLLKTGRMIQASVAGAAAFLDADDQVVEILEQYGKEIGIAFQIADDILDIVADEKELGKPVGSDAEIDKSTYPSLLGLDEAKKAAKDAVGRAKKILLKLPDSKYREMLAEFSTYIIERKY